MTRVALALLAVLVATAGPAPTAQTPWTKALVGGTLIDGFGGTPIRNSVILVEGDRIKAVGQVGTLPVPSGAEVISTEGMSVLPGLWDMHVHLMINGHSDYEHWDKTYPSQFESVIMPASARQLLMAGVTSARDLGAPLEASISVRDRINGGKFQGRRFTFQGPSFSTRRIPAPSSFAGV
jgi:imidazolonepropionase-like amidohydrolase